MAWIHTTESFDWKPPGYKDRVTQAYKADRDYCVTHVCAEYAVAKGHAYSIETPPRPAGETGEKDNGNDQSDSSVPVHGSAESSDDPDLVDPWGDILGDDSEGS